MLLIRTKSILQIYLVITIIIISSLNTVSAEQTGCCEETASGDTCLATTQENCKGKYQLGVQCEDTNVCNVGCCLVNNQCASQTGQYSCTQQGGAYFDAECSGIKACQEGCCQIGDNFFLASQQQCMEITRNEGLKEITFFPEIIDEFSCLEQKKGLDEGCCASGDICAYTTRELCGEGIFEEKKCSDIALCACDAKAYTGCVDEDVYYFDSCGNKEELAEDCDYNSGTICSEDKENVQCVSVNCKQTLDRKTLWGDDVRDNDGGPRKNGESWCQYDGAVGVGNDLVGSRHYRHMCVNGKELVEPCKDYREEYCIEGEVEFDGGEVYNQARCITNSWEDCTTECNSAKGLNGNQRDAALQKDKVCCENPERSCLWKGVLSSELEAAAQAGLRDLCEDPETGEPIPCATIRSAEDEGVCIPLVPPGLVFWEEDNDGTQEPSADIVEFCDAGTNSCEVFFTKSVMTGYEWDCAGNCACLEPENFYVPTQSACNAYGDCGVFYNVAGKLSSDGYDCSTSDGLCYGNIHGYDYDFDSIDWDRALGGIGAYSKATPLSFGTVNLDNNVLKSMKLTSVALGGAFLVGAVALYSAATAPAGTSGILISIGTSLASACATTAAFSFGIPCLIEGIVAAIIIATLAILSFTEDSDTLEITATCAPWQAPRGSEDCELCRDSEIFEKLGYDTCSEYRCKSLGTACKYVQENEGSPRNPCLASNRNDVSAPIINPYPEVLTEGYSIEEYTNGYEITPIVDPFNLLTFGIITDEPAQCKFSTTPGVKYEEMPADFGESYFSEEHALKINPTPTIFNEYYVRCEDINGRSNDVDYKIEFRADDAPDLTPPILLETSVISGASVLAGVEQLVEFELNEPSTCTYGTNSMQCTHQSGEASSLAKYVCKARLQVTEGINEYNITCQDFAGNKNAQSYLYVLEGVEGITIESLGPEGELETNLVTLEIITSGAAICKYTYQGEKQFEITGETVHNSELPQLQKGTYNIPVSCEDGIGTVVISKISFIITKDDTAPKVMHLFTNAGNLIIETDEYSICKYSDDAFDFQDGTLLDGTEKEHSLVISEGRYHIICEDASGNLMDEIVVYP
ncbi:MAG: hypothetical protein AABW49_02085 [Nanoarchaeota archaeon]